MMLRYAASFTLFFLFVPFALAATQKRVLFLHDGSPEMPYHIYISTEMQMDLKSTESNVQIFDEYLYSLRLGRDVTRSASALQTKYAGSKFDVVVACGGLALKLLVNQPPPFLRGTPVVFVAIPDFDLPPTLPANVTGIKIHRDYADTVRLAMTLRPGLRHLYHLESASDADHNFDVVRKQLEPFRSRLDVVTWEGLPADEVLKQVESLPPDSAVLFDSYATDYSGGTYASGYFCSRLAAHANAPIYTGSQVPIGNGSVGGVVIDNDDYAKRSVKVVLGLLAGEPISQYPVGVARTKLLVDWRKVEQFGLSGRNLPPSAIVLFRPPSLWEKYHRYIIAAGIVTLLQTMLIIALVLMGKRCKRSERSAREVTSRLINAQEDERRRIAGELHDDVSQRLALIAIHVDTLRGLPVSSQDHLIRELSVLYDEVDLISSDIHQFSHKLHPAVLERLGLAAALRRYCAELSAHRKFAIQMSTTGEEPPMSLNTALAFFRIGQEALVNAAKHSGATSCHVWLTYARNRITLSVGDNGSGFDPESAQAKAGLGIQSMQERLRSIGGTLRIRSSVLNGTRVFAEARLEHAPVANAPEIPGESSDTASAALSGLS